MRTTLVFIVICFLQVGTAHAQISEDRIREIIKEELVPVTDRIDKVDARVDQALEIATLANQNVAKALELAALADKKATAALSRGVAVVMATDGANRLKRYAVVMTPQGYFAMDGEELRELRSYGDGEKLIIDGTSRKILFEDLRQAFEDPDAGAKVLEVPSVWEKEAKNSDQAVKYYGEEILRAHPVYAIPGQSPLIEFKGELFSPEEKKGFIGVQTGGSFVYLMQKEKYDEAVKKVR